MPLLCYWMTSEVVSDIISVENECVCNNFYCTCCLRRTKSMYDMLDLKMLMMNACVQSQLLFKKGIAKATVSEHECYMWRDY